MVRSSPGFDLLPRVRWPVIVINTAICWPEPAAVRRAGPHVLRRVIDWVLFHPVAVATAIVTRLGGWPSLRCLAVAALVDLTHPPVLARSTTPPARFLLVWRLACGFHRRWPSNLLDAERALGRQIVVGPAGASAVDTTSPPNDPRSDRAPTPPPTLAHLPCRIEGTTVAWAVDLAPAADPTDLGRRLQSLALIDPRILDAGIERRSGGPEGWTLVVDFDAEPPPWRLSVLDRRWVFVSIDSDSSGFQQHEEGCSHGDG